MEEGSHLPFIHHPIVFQSMQVMEGGSRGHSCVAKRAGEEDIREGEASHIQYACSQSQRAVCCSHQGRGTSTPEGNLS